MFTKLLHRTVYNFGFKDMKKAFYQFLNIQAGAVYRGAPQFKQRKYLNVQISQKFKQLESKRKQQRLIFAQKRKKLLQQKLSTQAKLLTQSKSLNQYEKSQLTKLNSQILSLKSIIDQQNQQLAILDKQLQQTEAQYILIEGPKKLVILNQITYLKHLNSIPSGVVLTPQSIKVVENVHYLVTHNLPVPRYKLYQLMPGLFTKQIGQLQQSVQRLIQQKNLNLFEQTTSHSIRQWSRRDKKIRDPIDRQLVKLRQQRHNMMMNMSIHAIQLLKPHSAYIQRVFKGQTPFRNIRHCFTALTSKKLNLKLNQQQEGFRKAAQQIYDDMQKFKAYCQQLQQRMTQIQYSYIEPPIYIKNHPVLAQLWDKYMQRHTNPIKIQDAPNYLPDLPPNDDGRAFMEQKLRKQVQKFDEQFVRLWHEDKSLLLSKKKQTQIQFYNISTKILQEYQALQDKSAPQQQFKKLPKKPKRKQQKFIRISMDQITKMIYLNNKDKSRFNLDFFAKYFGMQQPEQRKALFDTLNSISYLRVFAPNQDDPNSKNKQVKQEVLKFVQ